MKVFMFPGQGSQKKGMGGDLFDQFPEITRAADEILGYSIQELCLEDPAQQLGLTQFTQPALYVVNALTWMNKAREGARADFLIGHSLGEFNALLAADVFDFATGLKLVKERGRLMGEARGGGMAAVVGMEEAEVRRILSENGAAEVDIANLNTPTQIVISGPTDEIARLQQPFKDAGVRMYSILRVSAAFHSRYMEEASQAFERFMAGFTFRDPQIPVIANVTARPYPKGAVGDYLRRQIVSSVKWTETICYLMGKGVQDFEECGNGKVLAGLCKHILKDGTPLVVNEEPASPLPPSAPVSTPLTQAEVGGITAASLGSRAFREDYKLRYAYVAGSMYKGIASKELVVRMGRAGLMGYYGIGGLKLDQAEEGLRFIQSQLGVDGNYGVNLLSDLEDPAMEMRTVDLLLRYNVTRVEAASFLQVTAPLVLYRLKGATRNSQGQVVTPRHVIGKVSRPEVARAFMSPAPERILNRLVEEGRLSREEAELGKYLPVCGDICVEADSGGHTDMGVASALLPAMISLQKEMMTTHNYAKAIRVGLAGGIGTPESAAAAFVLGADFVLTGSINQCSPQAGTSERVKEMLSQINVQDTAYAPSGDMFELGARIQVLKRGLFFPARANKLYDLYRFYNSLEEIDEQTRSQIQDKYFKRSFDAVWQETRTHYQQVRPEELEKAERNPKHKMALVFKWYFVHTTRLAMNGSDDQKVDYQVHCGPAMGAFNQWVKGTDLENWRNRHVDLIADRLMTATAALLNERFQTMARA